MLAQQTCATCTYMETHVYSTLVKECIERKNLSQTKQHIYTEAGHCHVHGEIHIQVNVHGCTEDMYYM